MIRVNLSQFCLSLFFSFVVLRAEVVAGIKILLRFIGMHVSASLIALQVCSAKMGFRIGCLLGCSVVFVRRIFGFLSGWVTRLGVVVVGCSVFADVCCFRKR
jgi:hypothetical protein